ncbi:MAG: hypothetical protein PHX08_08095 [Lachnospiraceae bacterium]|nr:hypothetical protein [Lachnospiraceae bacterium]
MGIIELCIIALTVLFSVSTICDTVHKIKQDKYYYQYKRSEDETADQDDNKTE